VFDRAEPGTETGADGKWESNGVYTNQRGNGIILPY
jgi:hypothetical protein